MLRCVANPCQKHQERKSNLFTLKIPKRNSGVERFLANALRCQETLLLYSINYLLFCFHPCEHVGEFCDMFKNFCNKKEQTALLFFLFPTISECSLSSTATTNLIEIVTSSVSTEFMLYRDSIHIDITNNKTEKKDYFSKWNCCLNMDKV